jgi:hypothetical protein
MSRIQTSDLSLSCELDREAAGELHGGFAGFLSGLFAGQPGGSLMPSFTQNFYIDYDQTIVQQNPVNLNIFAGDGGVNAIGDISIMPVSAGSAMTVIQG